MRYCQTENACLVYFYRILLARTHTTKQHKKLEPLILLYSSCSAPLAPHPTTIVNVYACVRGNRRSKNHSNFTRTSISVAGCLRRQRTHSAPYSSTSNFCCFSAHFSTPNQPNGQPPYQNVYYLATNKRQQIMLESKTEKTQKTAINIINVESVSKTLRAHTI